MPRLDNSNPHVLSAINFWRDMRDQEPIVWNEEDPGDTPPVDVCWNDWQELFPAEDGAVEHPPYSDGAYTCECCGDPLTDDDN